MSENYIKWHWEGNKVCESHVILSSLGRSQAFQPLHCCLSSQIVYPKIDDAFLLQINLFL